MPLHWISRQTIMGWLFLALGLALIALAGAPIIVALRTHTAAPPVTTGFLVFLGIGVSVAVFGAWLLPSSGVGPVATQVIAVVGPYIPRLPGLSRVGDPKPPAPDPPPSDRPSHEP